MEDIQLEINGVSKSYGKTQALRDFTAHLGGGIYGLIGPNGAGKTTLINILTRNLQPDSGSITVNGESIYKMGKEYLGMLGFLPQYPIFYPNFRTDEFLKYICVMKNIPRCEHKKRIENALETVNLTDSANKKIGGFSGGMRQRLGIAQAVIGEPKMIILDEPTAGLDPQERIRFRNLISRLAHGRIILLSTHIVTDVESVANEVLFIKKGELVRCDTPAALAAETDKFVWHLHAPAEEAENIMKGRLVSAVSGDVIRIISQEKPLENAVPAKATLEDAYLYYFGEPL